MSWTYFVAGILGPIFTAFVIYAGIRLGVVGRALDQVGRDDTQRRRAAHAVERGAVSQMSREALEESALEPAKGSREQARRIYALEDALATHRRECCSRRDCCGALEVEAR